MCSVLLCCINLKTFSIIYPSKRSLYVQKLFGRISVCRRQGTGQRIRLDGRNMSRRDFCMDKQLFTLLSAIFLDFSYVAVADLNMSRGAGWAGKELGLWSR
jgi:hypothetical protein